MLDSHTKTERKLVESHQKAQLTDTEQMIVETQQQIREI